MTATTELPPRRVDGVAVFARPPAHRRFAAGDVIRLILGTLALAATVLIAAFASATVEGVEQDIIAGIARLPNEVEQFVIGSAQLFATFVPGIALVAVIAKRRWRVFIHTTIAALAGGLVLRLTIDAIGVRGDATTTPRADDFGTDLVASDFPTTVYLASAIAASTVGANYLPRRWRRALWGWVWVLVVLRFLGPGQPPLDILVAASIGSAVGALVLLILGTPNTEPSAEDLIRGIRATGIRPARVDRLGAANASVRYLVTDEDDRHILLKLRTPDDHDWDLLQRAVRALRLRSSELSRPFSTLKRRVEHEALALRTVRDTDTDVPALAAIGTTPGGAVMLAQEYVTGVPLSEVAPDDIDDATLRALYEQVNRVHRARVAHHHLTLDNVIVDGPRVRLVDFDAAEIAADDRNRARDVAGVLVAVGSAVGPKRTVATAVEVLGEASVNASLPLLQPLALSGSLGREARRQRGLLDRLRAEIHEQTGAEDVPLERLARVQPRTLVMILAGALAFYSLLPQFGNLDDTVDAFVDADYAWLPALFGAALAYYLFATISFLGSVAQRMPLAPSVRSQVASSFAQLVGPATAGRMALAGRFLQRNGLTGPEASASVALNSAAGVTTHLALMVGFFAWAGGTEVGGLSLPSLGTVLLVAGIAAVLLGLAVAMPYTRTRVIMPIYDGLRAAAGYTAQVLRSPLRVVGLLGGSTGITLSYLLGAIFAVEAFGGGVAFAEIGAAYLGAAAIANIAPTPGGIGPLEAAMIAALSGFGLAAGAAISAVLTFRLATFWLPILPGWIAFVWMERRGEI